MDDFLTGFVFREIRKDEADEAARIESICFPPNEACSREHMVQRTLKAPEVFLVAEDKKKSIIAGFLNGLATDEDAFRDEFFENAALHRPEGKNIMLLGLDVLPEYRRHGLAAAIMKKYVEREMARGRKALILTCLDSKVGMYEKMGYTDLGVAGSSWGGEVWHEMKYVLNT